MTSQFNFQPLNNPETGIHGYRLLVVILKLETEIHQNRLPVSKWSLGFSSRLKIRENETVKTLCDFGVFECTQDRFNLSFRFFNSDIWWRDTCSWKVQLEILKFLDGKFRWCLKVSFSWNMSTSLIISKLLWNFPTSIVLFNLDPSFPISSWTF